MDEYAVAEQAKEATGMLIGGASRRLDITLRQNIDERIKQAHAAAKELEDTKARMEASGILGDVSV